MLRDLLRCHVSDYHAEGEVHRLKHAVLFPKGSFRLTTSDNWGRYADEVMKGGKILQGE